MSNNKFGKSVIAYSLSSLCLGLTSPTIAAADSYQFEVSFTHLNSESGGNPDISFNGLNGNYYLTPVSTKGKPLAEAAFLEHASYFGALILNADLSGDIRGDGQSWGIEYTQAKKDSPWAFNIGFLKTDLDMKSGSAKTNYESDSFAIGLGYYLDNSTLVSGEFANISGSYSGSYSTDADGKEYSFTLKKVTLLSPETAFNFIVNFTKEETEDDFGKEKGQSFSLAGDYYLSSRTSIGGVFTKHSHDDADLEGETIGINITSFVEANLYLQAALEQFDADSSSDADSDSWQITLGYRF